MSLYVVKSFCGGFIECVADLFQQDSNTIDCQRKFRCFRVYHSTDIIDASKANDASCCWMSLALRIQSQSRLAGLPRYKQGT